MVSLAQKEEATTFRLESGDSGSIAAHPRFSAMAKTALRVITVLGFCTVALAQEADYYRAIQKRLSTRIQPASSSRWKRMRCGTSLSPTHTNCLLRPSGPRDHVYKIEGEETALPENPKVDLDLPRLVKVSCPRSLRTRSYDV